jgi:hypothetical protein
MREALLLPEFCLDHISIIGVFRPADLNKRDRSKNFDSGLFFAELISKFLLLQNLIVCKISIRIFQLQDVDTGSVAFNINPVYRGPFTYQFSGKVKKPDVLEG